MALVSGRIDTGHEMIDRVRRDGEDNILALLDCTDVIVGTLRTASIRVVTVGLLQRSGDILHDAALSAFPHNEQHWVSAAVESDLNAIGACIAGEFAWLN